MFTNLNLYTNFMNFTFVFSRIFHLSTHLQKYMTKLIQQYKYNTVIIVTTLTRHEVFSTPSLNFS